MATTFPAWLRRVKGHAVDLLFPARCLSCGIDLHLEASLTEGRQLPEGHLLPEGHQGEVNLCTSCIMDLEAAGRSQQVETVCRRCAARIPAILGIDCPQCSRKKLWFDQAMALGPYERRLRKLVLRMKRDRTETIAQALGKLLCQRLELPHKTEPLNTNNGKTDNCREARHHSPKPELKCLEPGFTRLPEISGSGANLVVPVPMRPWRQVTRGTNGPAILARIIGSHLGFPVLYRALRCRRNSSPQKGLSRQSRFLNMRGGMVLQAGYSLEAAKVLLVDDIMTTGATCSEAARMLKQAGAAHISVIVIARTTG